MYTAPSIDDLLAGMQVALQEELMPFLGNPKAMATAAMMQAVIQEIRQVLPVYDANLVDEHNDMVDVMGSVAETLAGIAGPSAESIRRQAATGAARPKYPIPVDRAELMAAHRALSTAMLDILRELDALQRDGIAEADAAVGLLRAHMGPRLRRDADVYALEGGFIGRN